MADFEQQGRGDLLNPAQFNRVSIVLRGLEMSLREAEDWLSRPEEVGILYRRRLTLSPERRAVLGEHIAAGLQEIATLASSFGLQSRDDDIGKHSAAEMSDLWADLIDSRSNTLKCYGAVDPRLAELLDPSVSRLVGLALAVVQDVQGDAEP